MKKILMIFAISAIAFSGCKKNQAFKDEDGKVSEDNQNVQSHADAAITDATNSISEIQTLHGGRAANSQAQQAMNALTIPCGASIDSTTIGAGTIRINYDDVTACNNRKRGGSIKLTILNYASGTRWNNPGAVLEVVFTNYKVTRVSDGKSIKLNGTANITNISGGRVWQTILPIDSIYNSLRASSIVHMVNGSNINVTFDESETAVWNINRKYTYTGTVPFNSAFNNTPVIKCVGEGTGTSNGISNLENWGTTRSGDAFTNQVTEPVVWNTSCGAWAPLSGKLKLKVEEREFELITTLGVNAQGTPVSSGLNQCAYGLKVEWTYRSRTGNRVYGYP